MHAPAASHARIANAGSRNLVILFASDDASDPLAALVADATGRRDDCELLRVDASLAELDREAMAAMLAKRSTGARMTICMGLGEGGRAAIETGLEIGASHILAIAPVPFALPPTATGTAKIDILLPASAPDELETGLPADVSIHRLALPTPALLHALEHCDSISDLLDATAPASFAELPGRWRGRLDHRIEIDEASIYQEADGRMRMRGQIRHLGILTLRLDADPLLPIRIGARVLDGDGVPVPGIEGRAGLTKPILEPGETASFALTLPRFDPATGDASIEITLVCEHGYWFSEAGFHTCRLAAEQAPVPSPSAVEEARATVQLLYRALLGRQADDEGLGYFSDLLARGEMDERQVAWALIDSPEFRSLRRQHGFPTPEDEQT